MEKLPLLARFLIWLEHQSFIMHRRTEAKLWAMGLDRCGRRSFTEGQKWRGQLVSR